jgi:integrase
MGSIYKRKGSGVYQLQWVDENGKTQRRSSRTGDKAEAARLLASVEHEVWKIREGLVDRAQVTRTREMARPIGEVIDEYLEAVRATRSQRTMAEKTRQLRRLAKAEKLAVLADLDAAALRRHMRRRVDDDGKSHCEANHARKEAVAMMNWLRAERRIAENPLECVEKLDDQGDEHRVYKRRALSVEEFDALLAVAREADERLNAEGRAYTSRRELYYALAMYAGLRKGDLARLRWGDIDRSATGGAVVGELGGHGTITVRNGKAKSRTDVLQIHSELAPIIDRCWPAMAHPRTLAKELVFTEVTDETRAKDFERARAWWIDRAEDDRAERERREKSWFMLPDAQDRRIDLHSLRSTLGTMLARAGTPIASTKRHMRHRRIETTEKFYTHLSEADDRAAIERFSMRPSTG